MISVIFVLAGFDKITGYADTQGYMESVGVPGMLLPLVIAVEIPVAIAVILGWQTRLAAFALAGFCILSAVIFHNDFGNQMQMIMFLKNIAIAGGFLMLVASGPGAYALDNRGESEG